VPKVSLKLEERCVETLQKVVPKDRLAFGKAAKKRGLTEDELEQEIGDDLEKIRSEMYKEQSRNGNATERNSSRSARKIGRDCYADCI